MEKIKIRATALEDNKKKFAVVLFGEKLAVAFGRDSGAKVGYNARLISGVIDSGGSKVNWYCYVKEGSVFELEVDAEVYMKNKNRIKKWKIEEIEEFSISKSRADFLLNAAANIE